jgi:hypothetical protein
MSDYDAFLVSRLAGCLALDIVESWNVHAVTLAKCSVDKHLGLSKFVLIFYIEEVKRTVAPPEAIVNSNINVLSKYRGDNLEVFEAFDHADVLLVIGLLGHALEVLPLGEKSLSCSHDFGDHVCFTHE